ncbi:MAG: lysophospholipid acyltransferase family protein [Anaerolineales bacterium]
MTAQTGKAPQRQIEAGDSRNPVISLATSRVGPLLGILMGRLLPSRLAVRLADRLAAWAAYRPESQVVRAVRANQAVVRGWSLTDPRLNEAVFRVFKNAAHGYLTFFRGLARGRDRLGAACKVDPLLVDNLRRAREQGRGVFVVGPHMGNFDIALVALHQLDFDPLVLTYRNPRGSYLADNAIRQSYGVELTPISIRSLREAFVRLKRGGMVLTLVDRPDSQGEQVDFFGRSARLPLGHARLALRAGGLIQVGAALKDGDRGYRIEAGELIDPQRRTNESEPAAARRIAEQIAGGMEPFIRRRPDEWLMFLPVWPDALSS